MLRPRTAALRNTYGAGHSYGRHVGKELDSLHSQLLLADETSLSIIAGGPVVIEDFDQYWTNLHATLLLAMDQQTMGDETITLAHKVASRMENLAERLLDLYDEVDALSASLTELEDLFTELSLEDRDLAYVPKHDPSTTLSAFPSYIRPAYTWLLKNLHNPYPSKEVKTAIAQEAGSSIGYLDNWFRDVRKRIGWTDLCKQQFSNKRILIVQAATRFFQHVPLVLKAGIYVDNRLFDSAHDVDFNQIEANANDLYSGKFDETYLATTLDAVVKDLTPEIKALVHLEQQSKRKSNTTLSYSSPNSSPRASSSTSSDASSSSGERPNKRRSSCSPEIDHEDRRSLKRSRVDSISDHVVVTNSPSPTSSIIEPSNELLGLSTSLLPTITSRSPSPALIGKCQRLLSDPDDQAPLPRPLTPSTSLTPSKTVGKRKRHLSAANDQPQSKRPNRFIARARLQTVSDPFPMSEAADAHSTIEDWWQHSLLDNDNLNSIHIPSSVVLEIPENLTPLDVQYHNYADISSCIPNFGLWPDHWETPAMAPPLAADAHSVFSNNQTFSGKSGDLNVSNDHQAVSHTSLFGLRDCAVSTNAGESSMPYSTTDLYSLINQDLSINQNLSISTFFPDLDLLSAWDPQNNFEPNSSGYGNHLPHFSTNFESAIHQIRDPYVIDDKLAKHERAERLREELRRLEEDLAS